MLWVMSKTRALPGMEVVVEGVGVVVEGVGDGLGEARGSAPRLRVPDRVQLRMEVVCLEDRLEADHRARLVWNVVSRLDLSRFLDAIAARGEVAGRPSTDPRVLVSLWLYATLENVGSARRLADLCERHDAYRWLCGGLTMNHHTLSDFRVEHEATLDDLLTQVITSLVAEGVVKIDRLSQDGLRVRASAGKSSYRRRAALERLREKVRADIERLKRLGESEDDPRSPSQRGAQERAAREREERVTRALELLPELEAIKTHPHGKPSKHTEARVSTTDPEARRMKRGDGSIGPAYNVQFSADVHSRAIVGVAVTTEGDDRPQSEPMREQVEQRTGHRPREHLYDGGYVKKELIESAAKQGVAVYAPLPKDKHGQPCESQPDDTPGVQQWRARMSDEQGQQVYRQRASTSETINADLSSHRTLSRLNVRGTNKVRCVALWAALAYNLLHFGSTLIAT
jgi:transposase